jgi:TnpA family transposase
VDCHRHAPILISLSGPTRQRFEQIAHQWSRAMAKRKLLKDQDRRKLVDIPVDEDNLIRHYSLSLADRLEIELRRRNHNRLGFAIQLCA